MRATQIRRFIPADRSRVYKTILDPELLPAWKVPDGMDLEVHEFDAREGGQLRISLTYRDDSSEGKSSAHTDTYYGRFLRLIPDELIVEQDHFESTDPSFAGPMTVTIRLAEAPGGTELVATHEGVPDGVALADNELGWNMALDKLAALMARH